MGNKISKLFLVEKRNDSSLNINSLPEDVFIKIFSYLDFKELCRIGRVCKIWYEITRQPMYWKRVVTDISRNHHSSMSEKALKLAEILPPCVSYVELNFEETPERRFFELRKFSSLLRARCLNLEAIILRHVRLFYRPPATMNLSNQMPENIRVFVMHNIGFMENPAVYFSDSDISKVEVLDLRCCSERLIRPFLRSHFPYLKKLRLAKNLMWDAKLASLLRPVVNQIEVLDLEDTMASDITFDTIRMYGFHLTELYMCNTLLDDACVIIDKANNALQRLKVICLRNCEVSSRNIELLMKYCQSLQRIYVGGRKRGFFGFHGYIDEDFSTCTRKSEIVQVAFGIKYCNHGDKINYMYE